LHIPVVADSQGNEFVGILDINTTHCKLSAEPLARQHEADSIYECWNQPTLKACKIRKSEYTTWFQFRFGLMPLRCFLKKWSKNVF